MAPSFDSLLYIDADDSTLKNTGIYYNRVSQYTYFPTGIVIDTLNSEAAITVRSPNSTEYPSIPLKLYPASTNENVGHVIINPMLQDTFYNGSWLNRISTGGVSIGGQLYGETRKSEMIVGAEGFYFINRFYHADENDGCIHIDNSHNLYITDTTGANLGLSLAVGGSPNPTRGISLGEDGSHIYDSLFLHGIKEDLTSDTVDILFMKHGYEVKKRSLADFADTIIKIIEATDTVYVDSSRAAWKADTLVSDSLRLRELTIYGSDTVSTGEMFYIKKADTAIAEITLSNARIAMGGIGGTGTTGRGLQWTSTTGAGNAPVTYSGDDATFTDDVTADSVKVRTLVTSGNVGIGTTTPTAKLQIEGIPSNTFGIIAGNNVTGGGMTDDTRKYLRIGCPSYDIDEEPVSIITADNNGTANILHVGGGAAYGNAPTEINFRTAALNTIIGTLRMIIDRDGKVGIGTDAPAVELHVNGTIRSDDLTASMVVVTDANKNLVSSNRPVGELDFLYKTLRATQTLVDGTPTAMFEVSVTSGSTCAGKFSYSIKATSTGSHAQSVVGEVIFNSAYDGLINCGILEGDKLFSGAAGTSMPVEFSIAASTDKVIVSCNANSSLTSPTITITLKLEIVSSNGIVTIL
jgi:hypothetical protein